MNRSIALILSCVATAIIAVGCSDSPTDSEDATVSMQAEMTTKVVTGTRQKGTSLTAGALVDSLKVTRVRILISELKLHRDKENDTAGDRTVKIGPNMIDIDTSGVRAFASGTVPSGAYDKVKFEFHRLSSSEVAQYLNDPIFSEFVTNERSTFVINGSVFVDGVETPFVYKSDATANLSYKFEPAITLNGGTQARIVFQVDPIVVFKDGGKVLDPRDPSNESKIDNAIKSAIKALKR